MALTFGGLPAVQIPAGARGAERPGAPAVKPLARPRRQPVPSAGHRTGNPTRAGPADQLRGFRRPCAGQFRGAFTTQSQSWYFIDSVDVTGGDRYNGTVVTLGDSITDGYHSSENANARWPNDLARRLDALRGPTLSVADEGISGNRVLNNSVCCGVDALARLDRDVLTRAGARDVILLEGINDIGFSQLTGP